MSALPCINNPLVLGILESLGIKPDQCGDFTIRVDFPVAGAVTARAAFNLFLNEDQLEAIKAVVDADPSAIHAKATYIVSSGKFASEPIHIAPPEDTEEDDQ